MKEAADRPWGSRILGGCSVLLGLAVFLETRGLAAWDGFGPGPRFFPLVGAALLVVFGGATGMAGQATTGLDRETWSRVARFVTMMVVCVLLLKVAGALIAFGLFCCLELRWVEKYTWLRAFLLAVVTVGILYTGFVVGLQVRLPPTPFLRW